MRITKYVHSCLLAETEDRTVLIDPGQFSWESGLFDINKLAVLDEVVITHEHFDHFHLPFVEALAEKFPNLSFVATPDVVGKLQQAGITKAASSSSADIEIFSTKQHAPLEPLGQAPQNIAVHFADRLTVGGDRHDLEETKDILALTVTAPWGSMVNAADMAIKLKPKYIVPVHDWHWSQVARQQAYERLTDFFKRYDIEFLSPIDGQPLEIQ